MLQHQQTGLLTVTRHTLHCVSVDILFHAAGGAESVAQSCVGSLKDEVKV